MTRIDRPLIHFAALLGLVVVSSHVRLRGAAADGIGAAAAVGRVSITDFGARAGNTVNTQAIQAAIDHCSRAGGGVVVVPPGTFVTGTLRLRSNVGIEVEDGAILAGSTRIKDYPVQPPSAYRSVKDVDGFRALIVAEEEHDVGLTGRGTIDGRGASFPFRGSDVDSRPRLILFVSCRRVEVAGLHLRNSAIWMQHYLNCDDVHIRGLTVWNHCRPNNDMLDIDSCRRVIVSDCVGDSEDDGIVLKSTGPAPCEEVVVTNCVVSSQASAIKLGSESTGGFRNIAISNCAILPSRAAPRAPVHRTGISAISLEIADGGTMDGISLSNIVAEGAASPLFIRLSNRGRKYNPSAATPPVGAIRNVRISNLLVRGAGTIGCSITGIPGHPVEHIFLSEVRIELARSARSQAGTRLPSEQPTAYPEATMWGDLPAYGFFVRHARDVSFRDVVVVPASGEKRPSFVSDDAAELWFDHTSLATKPTVSP